MNGDLVRDGVRQGVFGDRFSDVTVGVGENNGRSTPRSPQHLFRRTHRHLLLLIAGLVVSISPIPAHAATLSLSDATAIPSQTHVAFPLSLSLAFGEQLTAVTLDVQFDTTIAQWGSVTLDPAVVALGKQVTSNVLSPGHIRVIVYGLDRQILSAGSLGQLFLDVSTSAPIGNSPITLQNGLASDPSGTDVAVTLFGGQLVVQAPLDTVPPQLSLINATGITQTSATVSWTTNELSTSQVDYGLTTSYGVSTPLDATLVLAHSVALSGLTPGSLYHVRVRSSDAVGNPAVSADVTFTTLALPAVAAPTISPAGGSFTSSVAVSLSTTTSGASIRYTTNGSMPTASSPVSSTPLTLTASATVNAQAFRSGMTDSPVVSASFTVVPDVPVTVTASLANASSTGWNATGTDRYAWGAGQWLEFQRDFGTGGSWSIGLVAMNYNNPAASGLPSGYAFNIAVTVDGVSRGSFSVPGSTTACQPGSAALTMPSGIHTVRYTWTNDTWLLGVYDANIRVKGAVFTLIAPPPPAPTAPTTYAFTAGQASALSGSWVVDGSDRYSYNANQWLEYQSLDFGAVGTWAFSVTATNQRNSSAPGLPSGYAFSLTVLVDGVSRGTIQVPGSTTAYQTGTTTLSMPSGIHTVRFLWTNDAWQSGVYDANIRVRSVGAVKQ